MGLVLGVALIIQRSVAKELKIKARKFRGLVTTFEEVAAKIVWGGGEVRDYLK